MPKETIVPIDQAGRIVLPKKVRQELAIKRGDSLIVTVHGSSVTLTPTKETAGFVRQGKALVFTTGGDQRLTDAQVSDLLDDTREQRDAFALATPPQGKHRS